MEPERLSGIVVHLVDSSNRYPGSHYLQVILKVGTFTTGSSFVTNPAIRIAILKAKLPAGRRIGQLEFFVDHHLKIITSHEVKPTALLHGKNKELFQKIVYSAIKNAEKKQQ